MLERLSEAIGLLMVYRQAGLHLLNPTILNEWVQSAAVTGDTPDLDLDFSLLIPVAMFVLGLLVMLVL